MSEPLITLYVAKTTEDLSSTLQTTLSSSCLNNCVSNTINELIDPATKKPVTGSIVKLDVAPLTRVILFDKIDLSGINHIIDNTSKTETYKVLVNSNAAKFDPDYKLISRPIDIKAIIITPSNNGPVVIETFDQDDISNNLALIIIIIFIVIVLYQALKK
jgi:hypothetical protein